MLDWLWPRVIQQESGGNPFALSPKGAFGLAQLMPATAKDPGFGVRPFNPGVPGDNERMGKDYLTAMLARYRGDPTRALVAYNWGPGNADKWSGDPSKLPKETRNYVSTILGDDQPMRLAPAENNGMARGYRGQGASVMPMMNQAGGGGILDMLQQRKGGGLLGGNSDLGSMLLALGAGIASGSTEGWGSGIGKGLALAQQSKQNNRESRLAEQLLGVKMAEAGVPGAREALGIAESPFAIGDVKDRAGVEGGIRKEFTGLSGDYIKVRDSYSKIQAATSDPSPAGDMAVIFNYMRLLDPGSTVREGEYATAQNAGSVPDRVRNMYNMVIAGEKLTPDQRGDFTKQAKSLFGAQDRQQKKLEKQFKSIADRLGVDWNNIVPDYSIAEGPAAAAPAPGVAAAPAAAPGMPTVNAGVGGGAPMPKRRRYDPASGKFIDVPMGR
jgi:hypothetical protein